MLNGFNIYGFRMFEVTDDEKESFKKLYLKLYQIIDDFDEKYTHLIPLVLIHILWKGIRKNRSSSIEFLKTIKKIFESLDETEKRHHENK